MGWRQTILATSLLALSCREFSVDNARTNVAYLARSIAGENSTQTTQEYVTHNASRIARNISEVTGVACAPVPILFKQLPPGYEGLYDEKKNIIYLSTDNFAAEQQLNQAERIDLDMILTHELTHAAMDQYSENAGRGTWPDMRDHTDIIPLCNLRLISEGVATYTARQMHPHQSEFVGWTDYWPRPGTLLGNILFRNLVYEGGELLVKEIIQEHGARGIEYLTVHPPKVKSPRDLPAYKEEALAALRKKL